MDFSLSLNNQNNNFFPLFRNGHLQTIAARFWPCHINPGRYPAESRLFESEPGVRVLTHCHFAQVDGPRDTILIVHGLEGSSHSPYVVRLSGQALDAGFDVARLNIRNCGGTESLSSTLYHSGLTTDLRSVAMQLADRQLYIIGFSMGGNMALKLAGEWGSVVPSHVKAVCAVSPPIDLGACALAISQPHNRIYEKRFLVQLEKTLTRKKQQMSVDYSLTHFPAIRTLVDFDNVFTAPAFGFKDAFDYYAHASSKRFLHAIQAPTLVIQAQDDPVIPREIFNHAAFNQNPSLRLVFPKHGGHVAFISKKKPRFWAHRLALDFFNQIRFNS